MKVALIGSNGFLSRAFIKKSQNRNITVFGRSLPVDKDVTYVKCELSLQGFPFQQLLAFDTIIYLAALGVQSNQSSSIRQIYNINTFFPIELSNFLSEHKYRGQLITFGSYFEIGNNNNIKKFSATEVIQSVLNVNNNIYCISKRLLTRYINSLNNTFSLHLILPTIYGPGEQKHRLIPYVVNALQNNEEISLTSGQQVRQYLYVGDLVKIIDEFISARKIGLLNTYSPEIISIKQLIERVYKFFKVKLNDKVFGMEERKDVFMNFLALEKECSFSQDYYTVIEEILLNYISPLDYE